ncbi:MAG TPA: hypothetical protein VMG82_39400 [Candidatus Sulfotelmatobacter sp.]|nr:hypothetical protein [Candidatus Sulfotelmatobacter sp.]
MTQIIRSCHFAVNVALSLALLTGVGLAANPHCSDVGGAILTNLGGFGLIDGSPTTLGVATGDLKGALGVQILSASADFTTITVQHHWVTETGETLTIDPATLHGTFVAPGLLAVVQYKVHLSGGTGRFAKATGDMSAIGELDLNTGDAVLRYSGKVCSAN